MHGRRRNSRYRLSSPLAGTLLVPKDISIERQDEREVVALSDVPAPAGQRLTLEPDGERDEAVLVRVVESTPILVEREVRYRLRLAIED